MKALIYNSGLGKRMGDLTKDKPKSMVKLKNGETIFERQLRLLRECGIKDVVVTTGPFKEIIEAVTKEPQFSDMHFTLVENPIYDKTNYIYSMYCARDEFDDDMILLHSDLVFNRGLLEKVLASPEKDLVTINRSKPLPEKDFKGRVVDGALQEVSINIFDKDCFALQPMYKLSKETIQKWLAKTVEFVESGNTNVYAENAFNEILPKLNVREFSYEKDYIDEIDNPDDLARVSEEIRGFDFAEQRVFDGVGSLKDIFDKEKPKKVMVVFDKVDRFNICGKLDELGVPYVSFSDFGSNPKFEEVAHGIELYRNEGCDFILSIGGGSAIDTAKVIKLYSTCDRLIDSNGMFIPKNHQMIPTFTNNAKVDKLYSLSDYIHSPEYKVNPAKHLAIPTTAGTGSESTRYSVCYLGGVKQSITHDTAVPDYVVLEPNYVIGLPDYHKKSTLMDALAQAIESYWSVNSTDKSKEYSRESIKIILKNIDKYMNDNDLDTTREMLRAANLAGKAINITQTTSAHAMSYKITSMYNVAHGHAVMLTLPFIWEYMEDHINERCIDKRGPEYLERTLKELREMVGGYQKLLELFESLNLGRPFVGDMSDFFTLARSVNPDRLRNNPESLTEDDIRDIYMRSLNF